jgi:hypothetical protein
LTTWCWSGAFGLKAQRCAAGVVEAAWTGAASRLAEAMMAALTAKRPLTVLKFFIEMPVQYGLCKMVRDPRPWPAGGVHHQSAIEVSGMKYPA